MQSLALLQNGNPVLVQSFFHMIPSTNICIVVLARKSQLKLNGPF